MTHGSRPPHNYSRPVTENSRKKGYRTCANEGQLEKGRARRWKKGSGRRGKPRAQKKAPACRQGWSRSNRPSRITAPAGVRHCGRRGASTDQRRLSLVAFESAAFDEAEAGRPTVIVDARGWPTSQLAAPDQPPPRPRQKGHTPCWRRTLLRLDPRSV